MDLACFVDVLRGHPFWGVPIAVHSSLKHNVKLLDAENNYIIIQCCSFIFVNAYLPCHSGRHDYCYVSFDVLA